MTPRDFALLAQEAYTAAPDIGNVDSASRAIVRQTTGGLVIAFRGSDDADSWETDFDAVPMDVPGIGAMHRGFWMAWQLIAVDVLAAVDGKPVTLVGHSLGGALALCAAIDMTISGNPPAAVYGFEAPRVSPESGAAALLSHVPVKLYRKGNDIVPLLPPNWPDIASVTAIGKPDLPILNTLDHKIAGVIDSLSTSIPIA